MASLNTASAVRIGVVIGSVRPNRFADPVARWIAGHIGEQEGVEVTLLDLLDYDLPHFKETVAPKMLGDNAYEHDEVARWTRDVERLDGFVLIAPEYNHGYTGVLKNALDYVYKGWVRKPVAFVGYGNMGGARAIEQLRQVVVELEMAPIPTALHLPVGPLWAHYSGGDPSGQLAESADKADAMIADLLWWARALKVAREDRVLAAAS